MLKSDFVEPGKLPDEHLLRALLLNELKHLEASILLNSTSNASRLILFRWLLSSSVFWFIGTLISLWFLAFSA